MHNFRIACWVVLIGCILPQNHAACPKLRSGKCFVDCTQTVATMAHRIVCEQVTGKALHMDLETFAGLNATFSLSIWNVPGISRLGGNIFAPVMNLMGSFEMLNAVNLRMFPELSTMTILTNVTIRNAPLLTHLPLELLPNSVKHITLRATGITQFVNNKIDTDILPNLESFKITSQVIDHISQFFTNFPSLKSISISKCQINAAQISRSQQPFLTSRSLDHFTMKNNKFSPGSVADRGKLFLELIESLRINENTSLNFNGNDFPITKNLVEQLSLISQVKHLSLRENHFDDYVSLTGQLSTFNNLQLLDLGRTFFPFFHGGALSGLPKLMILKLDGNILRDLSMVDIFKGINPENLTLLDMSENAMKTFPLGLTETVGENLTELYLANNVLDPSLFWEAGLFFQNLRILSLASNRLTEFNGMFMNRLRQLEKLDLSCNKFANITKKYFSLLPASLKLLNMTFCITEEWLQPHVEADAFSKFPKIESLHFGDGYFKAHILLLLQKMPVKSAAHLKELYLQNNRISYISAQGGHFNGFTNLEMLDLSGNVLQSISSAAFATLTNLKSLRLSRNALFSITIGNFAGLKNLEYLDLSDNNIVLFSKKGALDDLEGLKGLFIGGNRISNLLSLFNTGGKQLEHLSIDSTQVNNCIDAKIFSYYRKLKWLYFNNSLPILLDMDPVLNLYEQEGKYPMHPWARTVFCDDQITIDNIPEKALGFLRFTIDSNGNKIYQDVMGFFAAVCFDSRYRYLSEITTSLICPSS